MAHPLFRRLVVRPPVTFRYQAQAVLRRITRTEPLLLVGVTLDRKFFPRRPRDATGTLSMTKGLVALSPLSAVDAVGSSEAAPMAMAEANEEWDGDHSPDGGLRDPA